MSTQIAKLAGHVHKITTCPECGGTGSKRRMIESSNQFGPYEKPSRILTSCEPCGGLGYTRRKLREAKP